ncbi:MAG: hypothetical protein KAW92_01865 [Candidatus Cloacimonetes bacterium]|nr:hypothetical protein [Candidatus Cloacimonadota bacterium]
MNKEEKSFFGAVAILDIIGFGSRMKSLGIEEMRDKVIGGIIRSTYFAYRIVKNDFERFNHFSGDKLKPGILYFADSIILYLPLGEKSVFSIPKNIIDSMIFMCSLLIAQSICINIPLRGAISFGECMVSYDPVFILGKPFIEAHYLEKQQMWAGAVLAKSAKDLYNNTNLARVVEYDVPCKVKGQPKLIKHTAVKWPENLTASNIEEDFPDWNSCFYCSEKDEDIQSDVQEKKKNTIEFFKRYKDNSSGITFGKEQKNNVGDWREIYQKLKYF